LSPDNRRANGLPFEALFAARDALFRLILATQAGEYAPGKRGGSKLEST